ncbi:hypothetical protein MMC07_000059 [Pseudocyphellaria aurata]|nr:hypothetical protein [Pseudocyphellaria aurata]
MLYLVLAFLALAAASSTSNVTFVPKGAICRSYTVPVTVTSANRPWVGPRWTDNYEFIDFVSIATTRVSAGFPLPVGSPVNQTASYEIAATFCTPERGGAHSKTVLLATHGLGFDSSYWNSPYEPDNYNFVQFAVARGYSVFFYDRLGVGKSTKVSGYDVQLSIGIAVLSSLAKSVRQGRYTTIGKPKHLVLVGHSFGSFSTNGVVAREPDIADAAILTGYGLNETNPQVVLEEFAPRIARLQRRRAFAAFDSGYITSGDIFGTIQPFFKAPAYDRRVAAFADATKQPFSISELVSLFPQLVQSDAPRFKGPTFVITGEYDAILCAGYCPGNLDQPIRTYFRGSSDFQSYIQPGAGHGLNYAINATGAYSVIFDFLRKHDF